MLFIMRMTIFILMAGLIQVSASVYSQATKLNVDMKYASFGQILDEIKKQSEFNFIYRSDIFDKAAPVNIQFVNATIEQILDYVLVPEGFEYEIVDNVVVIRKKSEVAQEIIQPVE